jgi:hypothetical protein
MTMLTGSGWMNFHPSLNLKTHFESYNHEKLARRCMNTTAARAVRAKGVASSGRNFGRGEGHEEKKSKGS